jgi:hypothetical protein
MSSSKSVKITLALTPAEANLLCEAHEVHALLANSEELEILEDNNPDLLRAYEKLVAISKS